MNFGNEIPSYPTEDSDFEVQGHRRPLMVHESVTDGTIDEAGVEGYRRVLGLEHEAATGGDEEPEVQGHRKRPPLL